MPVLQVVQQLLDLCHLGGVYQLALVDHLPRQGRNVCLGVLKRYTPQTDYKVTGSKVNPVIK